VKLVFFQQEETERTELKLTPLFPLLPPVQLCFRFPPVLLLLFLAVFLFVPAAFAHESRPAYLEIDETAPGRYDVLWRTPVLSGMRLLVMLKSPDDVRNPDGALSAGVAEFACRAPLN
jgi:hypothetical protein